ncbi:MAG: flagellar hook protein FlgE [Spirochaetales bacterium]|nr:flagellar hook protein FlgE [Spirochaetales bacterium]
MMRSLYSGVSGMLNHQIRMDVIGNNVSNVNTHGFKKGRVNFQDLVSQLISGAAKPTEEVGGVNPKQVGLGSLVATIDTLLTQGSLQVTGNKTDCAVMGEGFFILKNADRSLYTRAGAFGIDKDGTLVNPSNGMRVQGWTAETVNGVRTINSAADLGDIRIPVYGKVSPKATQNVFYRSNLDQRMQAPPLGRGHTNTVDIYDSLGNIHQLRLNFNKVADTVNQWDVEALIDGQPAAAGLGAAAGANNRFTINFDTEGRLISITDAAGATVNQGDLGINLNYTIPGADQLNFRVNLGTSGQFIGATQAADASTNKAREQDGYGMGYLEDFQIDEKGVITGTYSNGVKQDIAKIALATFTNPAGLEKAGETNFVASNNSGIALVSPANTEGKGVIRAGSLEMSNVDLTEQFVDMIVTQRGFQANSRTITTSDQMLQEVLTLKR